MQSSARFVKLCLNFGIDSIEQAKKKNILLDVDFRFKQKKNQASGFKCGRQA